MIPTMRIRFEHLVWKTTGINLFRLRADRRFLERVLIPVLRSEGLLMLAHRPLGEDARYRVLSIGVDWHCMHYKDFFPSPLYEFWTVDKNPDQRPEIKGRLLNAHYVCAMDELDKRFPDDHFTLALCNGLLGWGLDTPYEIYQSFASLYLIMQPDSLLLVGYDKAAKPEGAEDAIERTGFAPYHLPCFGNGVVTNTSYEHTYLFYQKKSPT